MSAEQHRQAAPAVLGFAILTVSDSRAKADDVSGRTLRDLISSAGHPIVDSTLVPDAVDAIRGAVQRFLALPGDDGGDGLLSARRDPVRRRAALREARRGVRRAVPDALLPAGGGGGHAEPCRRRDYWHHRGHPGGLPAPRVTQSGGPGHGEADPA